MAEQRMTRRGAISLALSSNSDTDDPLYAFVTFVLIRLFNKCDMFRRRNPEEYITYCRYLAALTMEGFTIQSGFRFNKRTIKRVCTALVGDLQRQLGGHKQVREALNLQKPELDLVIVHAMQAQLRQLSVGGSKRRLHCGTLIRKPFYYCACILFPSILIRLYVAFGYRYA